MLYQFTPSKAKIIVKMNVFKWNLFIFTYFINNWELISQKPNSVWAILGVINYEEQFVL